MATPLIRYIYLLFLIGFVSITMLSDGFGEDVQISEPVNPGLNYLLSLTEPARSQNFDSGMIEEAVSYTHLTLPTNREV